MMVGALLAAAILPVGCGDSGGSATGATAAAQTFIKAITRGDTHAWCPQIDDAILGGSHSGGLPAELLEQCEQHDLFLITGSCDREAAVAGASIKGLSASGNHAEVELSSGAKLRLRLTRKRWLIADVIGGHVTRPAPAGPCSPASNGSS